MSIAGCLPLGWVSGKCVIRRHKGLPDAAFDARVMPVQALMRRNRCPSLGLDARPSLSRPEAFIFVGRDQFDGAGMTGSQQLDFEVIKREYANMLDIITYDDLLRRLSNTIDALGG